MIKINNAYLDQFISAHHEYLYPISKGIYLAFDKKSLEFIGIEEFYLADPKKYNPLADDKLNFLIARNILEVL